MGEKLALNNSIIIKSVPYWDLSWRKLQFSPRKYIWLICLLLSSCNDFLLLFIFSCTGILKNTLFSFCITVFPRLSAWSRMSARSKEDILVTSAPRNESQMSAGVKWALGYRNSEINELQGAQSGKYGTHMARLLMITHTHVVSLSFSNIPSRVICQLVYTSSCRSSCWSIKVVICNCQIDYLLYFGHCATPKGKWCHSCHQCPYWDKALLNNINDINSFSCSHFFSLLSLSVSFSVLPSLSVSL